MKHKVSILTLLAFLLMSCAVYAVPTDITVKVKTKDAKFIGTSMGGALITIKNADTGELLAKGVTQGSTGNTKLIMKSPWTRGVPISTGAAEFKATIDINEPTLIEVTAYGPLAQRQSANRTSVTQWVVPGKHIVNGDAFMIEVPGLVVDVLSPPTHIKYKGATEVPIQVNVAMM